MCVMISEDVRGQSPRRSFPPIVPRSGLRYGPYGAVERVNQPQRVSHCAQQSNIQEAELSVKEYCEPSPRRAILVSVQPIWQAEQLNWTKNYYRGKKLVWRAVHELMCQSGELKGPERSCCSKPWPHLPLPAGSECDCDVTLMSNFSDWLNVRKADTVLPYHNFTTTWNLRHFVRRKRGREQEQREVPRRTSDFKF